MVESRSEVCAALAVKLPELLLGLDFEQMVEEMALGSKLGLEEEFV
jgi:hypothetical protein